MSERISRRRFLKYFGAGSVAVAVAAAGGYYIPRPEITRTETLTKTVMATQTVTTTPYSRKRMPDFWKGVLFVQFLRSGDGFVEPGMGELKKRLPANAISLWLPYYTETPTSDRIMPIYDTKQYGTPYLGMHRMDESWPTELIERTVDLAHGLGLRVAYFPCVGPVTCGAAYENELEPTPAVLKAYREFKAGWSS